MLSCFKSNFREKVLPIIRTLHIDENKRKIIIGRFVVEVELYDRKARVAETFYMIFNLIITIGSVVLPALLSIQNVNFSEDEDIDQNYRDKIYWLSWCISLLISVCNGLMQLLSLSKQYGSYILVREKLIAEGWKYLELCDEYKGKTHKENFTSFCEEIENIKKSQTEREIVFLNPKPHAGNDTQPTGDNSDDEEETQSRRTSYQVVQPVRRNLPQPPETVTLNVDNNFVNESEGL
jgi:hypothetical protein